jgi:phospho-2-dehydro-3-deoxyheptonate aldolase
MAQQAPIIPTTDTLHGLYPLDEGMYMRRDFARQRLGNILTGVEEGTAAIIGSCAMTEDVATTRREGHAQHEVTQQEAGLYVVHRRPPWKPRSNPDRDWSGLETGPSDNSGHDPEQSTELAYRILAMEALWGSGVAIEIGQHYHMERYGHLLTFGWFGGRNIGEGHLMTDVALQDTTLPLAVKNGLDGDIGPALEKVAMLTDLRGEGAAPVVLLYRGGENAKTPQTWEYRYREALEATEGCMIVDAAHGAEMAHDPNGAFNKSTKGQERALSHIIALAGRGETPTGVMVEASDAHSPTDPHISHQYALDKVIQLNALRRALVSSRV